MTDEDANIQVDAFITVLYQRFGVSESDVKQWIRVIPQLIDAHERSAKYGEFAAKALLGTVITVFVGSIFTGIGWAVVHLILEVTGG